MRCLTQIYENGSHGSELSGVDSFADKHKAGRLLLSCALTCLHVSDWLSSEASWPDGAWRWSERGARAWSASSAAWMKGWSPSASRAVMTSVDCGGLRWESNRAQTVFLFKWYALPRFTAFIQSLLHPTRTYIRLMCIFLVVQRFGGHKICIQFTKFH